MRTIAIPVDERTGKPKVTNAMKAECIGEFSWVEEAPFYDENGELHEDMQTVVSVPWTICKEIYKRMALAAARECV